MVDRVVGENPIVESIMGGMNPRHFLSGGLGAMPVDSSAVPFKGSWIISTGNIAADMYANVTAESGGRVLATRLWELTDISGEEVEGGRWTEEHLRGRQGPLPVRERPPARQ